MGLVRLRHSPALQPPLPTLTLHHSLFHLNWAMSCYKSLLWFCAPPSPNMQPPMFSLRPLRTALPVPAFLCHLLAFSRLPLPTTALSSVSVSLTCQLPDSLSFSFSPHCPSCLFTDFPSLFLLSQLAMMSSNCS